MENQLQEYKQKFIDEAVQLLGNLEICLMKLEKDSQNMELVEEVFRYMHTLKGVSSMYGFDTIAEITHKVESVYDLIRENQLSPTPQLIQITLTTSDYIKSIFEENATGDNLEIFDKIVKVLNNIVSCKGLTIKQPQRKRKLNISSHVFSTWQITYFPNDSIFLRNINLLSTFQDLFLLGSYKIVQAEQIEQDPKFTIFLYTDKSKEEIESALFFIMEYCKVTKIAEFDIFNETEIDKSIDELKKQNDFKFLNQNTEGIDIKENRDDFIIKIETSEHKAKEYSRNRITVDSAKLDELMYLVSELITTNSQLVLATKSTIFNPVRPIFEKIDKLSKQFRNNTLNLRLVPINEMVVKFTRLVRDLSIQLGKEVELVTQGTETELDKSTIDVLADPLMHLIRNCIDHGIETPDIRIGMDKPPKGIIKITAFHSGNFVFIQVQDDGKGIDVEKIRQKAIEKNIIAPETKLSEKEAYDLIFLPGFSTAESLTQVSGRGVGMDVVKKKLSELRAQIEITSEKGLGTAFTIKLHQSIAILDTMLFKLDDMFFMVPLSDIEECRLIDNKELEKRKYTGTIPYNEKLIPFVDLYQVFNLKMCNTQKQKLLIINRQETVFAFSADIIIGEHQAVLKSLGHISEKQPYIAVASVLGNGNLAYLLDMNSIQNILLKIHN